MVSQLSVPIHEVKEVKLEQIQQDVDPSGELKNLQAGFPLILQNDMLSRWDGLVNEWFVIYSDIPLHAESSS